ncbi:MAG: class I SAM-dependent methyltransferase [Myxococcales bacterium]|nr:class I SAM-dependent methyltransferase [Myxococcales bacterium]
MSAAGRSLEAALEGAFGHAEPGHYEWQTGHPIVSRHERALVRSAFLPLGSRVLDAGCAEGATLFHLGDPPGSVGLDLFDEKLDFARTQVKNARFVKGSLYELPFEDGAFDHVIVRDVIHHLDEPERAVTEIARVLTPDGRGDVLEPCRNNPLIFLHGLLKREERGELRSDAPFLRALLAERFVVVGCERHQPLPLHRLLYHPGLGRVALRPGSALSELAGAVERELERVIPRPAWAYVHVRATRRALA